MSGETVTRLSEAREKEIREALQRTYSLMAARHYSLETGCDAWLELKKLFEQSVERNVPELLAELDALREELKWRRGVHNITGEVDHLKEKLAQAERERDQFKTAAHEWEMNYQGARAERDAEKMGADMLNTENIALAKERDAAIAERDKLASDALVILSANGICTPEKGYVAEPYMLALDIKTLARERDRALREVECLREGLRKIPIQLRDLANHYLVSTGNLSQERKVWAHDDMLVASGWIEKIHIDKVIEEADRIRKGE